MTDISPVSIMNYLKEFILEEIIICFEKRGIKFYQAKRDTEKFKLYQKLSIQLELNQSKIIDYLWNTISPQTIILYGSFSKGEAIEESDIDVFIIGKEQKVNLSKYKLGERIQLKFEKFPEKIPKELKTNLINGIVLKGYFNAL
jgi:predicted nucleotidyltransferase